MRKDNIINEINKEKYSKKKKKKDQLHMITYISSVKLLSCVQIFGTP